MDELTKPVNNHAGAESGFNAWLGAWISVEDRLPEFASRDDTPCFVEGKEIGATLTSEKVLVAIAPDNVVRIDSLVSLEGTAHRWFDMYGRRVTHWMTLPEAPNV